MSLSSPGTMYWTTPAHPQKYGLQTVINSLKEHHRICSWTLITVTTWVPQSHVQPRRLTMNMFLFFIFFFILRAIYYLQKGRKECFILISLSHDSKAAPILVQVNNLTSKVYNLGNRQPCRPWASASASTFSLQGLHTLFTNSPLFLLKLLLDVDSSQTSQYM